MLLDVKFRDVLGDVGRIDRGALGPAAIPGRLDEMFDAVFDVGVDEGAALDFTLLDFFWAAVDVGLDAEDCGDGPWAEEKMAGGSSRSPLRRVMVGDLVVRDLARGEVVLRVRARISKGWGEGCWRRAVITAAPWLPVAPVIRMRWGWGVVAMVGGLCGLKGWI